MQVPLISIIMPIYQVEKQLKRSLEDIRRQTYPNLQILLVDDGSPDGSGAICDAYQRKDSRFVAIHKENGGVSDARNAGLRAAKGEYIAFVDPDDSIAKDYITYLYRLLEHYKADISICEYQEFSGRRRPSPQVRHTPDITLTGQQALESFLYQKVCMPSLWGKLYKRELFSGLLFPKGRLYEDLAMVYKLLDRSAWVVKGNQVKYFYFQRRGSITHTVVNQNIMDRVYWSFEILEYVKKNRPALYRAAITRFVTSNLLLIQELPIQKQYRPMSGEAFRNIKKYRRVTIRDPKAKPLIRLSACFSYGGIWLLKALGVIHGWVIGCRAS